MLTNIGAQQDHPPALEGGRGFINTQTASTFGKGYLGINFSGIYNTTKIKGSSSREHLLISAASFTYDLSDDFEFAASLYTIGQGFLATGGAIPDKLQGGFGKSVLAAKYQMPINSRRFYLGMRSSIHIPMGANFTIHPSY
ncbi:MAG: hypothetical protein SCK70_04090, partial [bacterium]|nr:hypothetical protein [bacterium]